MLKRIICAAALLLFTGCNQQNPTNSDTKLAEEALLNAGSSFVTYQKSDKENEFSIKLSDNSKAYFQLMDNGKKLFTKKDSFKIDISGNIVSTIRDGLKLEPSITLTKEQKIVEITKYGKVSVEENGVKKEAIAQLNFAYFTNPSGLKNIGNELFEATKESGEAILTPLCSSCK